MDSITLNVCQAGDFVNFRGESEMEDGRGKTPIFLSLRATEGSVATSTMRIFFGDRHVASLLAMTRSLGQFEL